MSKKKSLNQGQQWMPQIQAGVEHNNGDRPKGMPTLEVLKAETAKFGLPDSDAEHMYDIWLVNGFKTARGRLVQNWKAAIRVWHREGFFPSQKRAAARPKFEDDQKAQLEKFRRAKHG